MYHRRTNSTYQRLFVKLFWDWKLDRGYLVHIKSFPQAPLRCRIEMGRSQKTSMPPWYLGVYLGKEAKPSEMVLFKFCWNAVTNDRPPYGSQTRLHIHIHIISYAKAPLAWAGGEERLSVCTLHLAFCILRSNLLQRFRRPFWIAHGATKSGSLAFH